MDSTRRYDARRPFNQSVTPGPLVGTTEPFVLETLSTGGLSLLRAATTPSTSEPKGLDQRFVWLTVPLPGSRTRVTALVEVVHREKIGSQELIRGRFSEMSFADRVSLSDYLDRHDSWQQNAN